MHMDNGYNMQHTKLNVRRVETRVGFSGSIIDSEALGFIAHHCHQQLYIFEIENFKTPRSLNTVDC